jgi:hypothetical protein
MEILNKFLVSQPGFEPDTFYYISPPPKQQMSLLLCLLSIWYSNNVVTYAT